MGRVRSLSELHVPNARAVHTVPVAAMSPLLPPRLGGRGALRDRSVSSPHRPPTMITVEGSRAGRGQ